MCLAIFKPATEQVSYDYLRNGFHNHSDGAGFAWAVDGQLHVKKGIFNADEMITQYELIKDYPALIHFRKATSGKVDETNCHPFLFNDNKLALIHNGVISIRCQIDGLSDTAHFVKLVIEPLVKKYNVPITDGSLNYLIKTSINPDKIAIMDGDGNCYLFNGEKGEWDKNIWYSNSSYKYIYNRTSSYSSTHRVTKPTYSSRHNSSIRNYDTHKNWNKRFADDNEGDEAYLEFWKRTIVESKVEISCCPIDGNDVNKKTQKLPLLTNGQTQTATVEEVEQMTDEQLEELTGGKTTETKTGQGHMMEYGWWDEQIESDVEMLKNQYGISREQAIIRVFNKR